MVNCAMWIARCVLCVSRKMRGERICVEECISGRNWPSPENGDLVTFWNGWEIVKLGLDIDNFSA